MTITTDELAAWSASLVHVIDAAASESVPRCLCRAIGTLVPSDFSSVFILRRESAPIEVFDDIPTDRESVAYVESPYLLDPVYNSFIKGTLPECALLNDIAPDDFLESDYFIKYWSALGVVSEFSFNATWDDDTVIHVPLARTKGSQPFDNRELTILRAIAPIVNAAMRGFWNAHRNRYSNATADADSFHRRLRHVLENFGSSVLTAREQEIVRLTMRGYSDKLAARELEISPGTVRNHKKSIFSKLGVSSQGEIFGLFLDVLHLPTTADIVRDPLTTLLEHRERAIDS